MIISRTPLRVSFFGGGTDYPDYYRREQGRVLGTTIDKYVYVSVNRNSTFFDYKTRVAYRKTELVSDVEQIEHPSVKACLKFLNVQEPLDINIFSDLPARTGLGSSSSFTVGLLNCLHSLKGKFVSPRRLAEEACYVEQELIGENVGSQDQCHAAHGGLNVMTFDAGGIHVEPLIASPEKTKLLAESWLMFYTGLTRYADPLLEEQVEKTRSKSNDQSLKSLKDLVDRGRSIFSETPAEAFVDELGQLFDDGWQMKKSLSSKVSSDVIDDLYSRAKSAGAIGGKLSGAGSGGFLSFIVPMNKQDSVRRALSGLRELKFNLEPRGSVIIYANV